MSGDLTAAAAGLNTTWSPSPVTMMDGQNVTERLSYMAENTTISFQDPDAMYNALFASLASGDGAFFGTLSTYTGPSTSLVFANGTTQTYQNNAYTRKDFTGVSSGPDFYNLCCNVTAKLEAPAAAATTAAATSAVPTATAAVTATGYPSPVVSSPDGSIAGYFLSDTGFENTAVLAITQETETDPLGAQTALTQFLDACRKNSKETLVIDIQSNPGGSILLGYDFFKQVCGAIPTPLEANVFYSSSLLSSLMLQAICAPNLNSTCLVLSTQLLPHRNSRKNLVITTTSRIVEATLSSTQPLP